MILATPTVFGMQVFSTVVFILFLLTCLVAMTRDDARNKMKAKMLIACHERDIARQALERLYWAGTVPPEAYREGCMLNDPETTEEGPDVARPTTV